MLVFGGIGGLWVLLPEAIGVGMAARDVPGSAKA